MFLYARGTWGVARVVDWVGSTGFTMDTYGALEN